MTKAEPAKYVEPVGIFFSLKLEQITELKLEGQEA